MKIDELIKLLLAGVSILLSSAFAAPTFGEIIPANRRMAWQAGVNVGVIGGIPNRTTIYKNLVRDSGADNTGATDCSAILAAAIDACPANQIVYLPSGRYRLNTHYLGSFKNNVTIRGAGQGKTIIDTRGSEAFHFGASNYPRPTATINITAGATAGSTTVTCGNTSSVAVGKMIRIEETNPTWVKALNGNSAALSYMFKVTAKTSSTVTFSPALPLTLDNSPKMAVYTIGPVQGVGIENLTIDLVNSTAFTAIYFEVGYNCWISDVEIKNAYSRELFMLWCSNCEIRKCYVHDARGTGPNHEGIDFYEDGCWNLIEDNIFVRAGFPMVIFGDSRGGCGGNVIGYNYCEDSEGSSIAPYTICDNHGPHNSFNLFEGNVAQMFESDGYFGSSSHGTLFRNWFSGNYSNSFDMHMAVCLNHFANYYNVVGNVLGDPTVTAVYDVETASYNGYQGTNSLIYRLGYPNAGNSSYTGTIVATTPPNYTSEGSTISTAAKLDHNVKTTIIRHGNYDYATRSTKWDSTISDHKIPGSLYYSALPSWWPAGVPWPCIGSDLSPLVSANPAQARYRPSTVNLPAPPTNLHIQ